MGAEGMGLAAGADCPCGAGCACAAEWPSVKKNRAIEGRISRVGWQTERESSSRESTLQAYLLMAAQWPGLTDAGGERRRGW